MGVLKSREKQSKKFFSFFIYFMSREGVMLDIARFLLRNHTVITFGTLGQRRQRRFRELTKAKEEKGDFASVRRSDQREGIGGSSNSFHSEEQRSR